MTRRSTTSAGWRAVARVALASWCASVSSGCVANEGARSVVHPDPASDAVESARLVLAVATASAASTATFELTSEHVHDGFIVRSYAVPGLLEPTRSFAHLDVPHVRPGSVVKDGLGRTMTATNRLFLGDLPAAARPKPTASFQVDLDAYGAAVDAHMPGFLRRVGGALRPQAMMLDSRGRQSTQVVVVEIPMAVIAALPGLDDHTMHVSAGPTDPEGVAQPRKLAAFEALAFREWLGTLQPAERQYVMLRDVRTGAPVESASVIDASETTAGVTLGPIFGSQVLIVPPRAQGSPVVPGAALPWQPAFWHAHGHGTYPKQFLGEAMTLEEGLRPSFSFLAQEFEIHQPAAQSGNLLYMFMHGFDDLEDLGFGHFTRRGAPEVIHAFQVDPQSGLPDLSRLFVREFPRTIVTTAPSGESGFTGALWHEFRSQAGKLVHRVGQAGAPQHDVWVQLFE